MGKGAPAPPDYEAAAREGVYADLETYPLRYLTEAASRMGGKVTIDGQEYDFTGLGDADNARVMSDKMAQTLLDLQRDLGPDMIRQRLEELKAADPQGYAARQQLFDRIIKQTEAQPDRPLAEDLQASIVGELTNAGRLDSRMLDEVQQNVRGQQVRNQNFLGNAAVSQEAGAAVRAGEGLRDQQQQQALGFLESGVTPEDVEYRRMQQNLANLGAFISGETPTSQFNQVSGAGNGAVPFISGGGNTQTTNPNAGQQGVNNALSIYSGNTNWAANQVNPYMAGISTAANIYSTGLNLGWNPGQQSSNYLNYGQSTNPHNF
jgi:hypothetical protein